MIAKVLTRQGKTWKSFKQLDEYIERFEACVATKHGNLDKNLPVPEQMDEVADKGTGRVRNPAYHFVLSWDKGNIQNQQMWSTVEKALTVLGCEKHQWIAARHADSKFEHCHVLVNRIHPTSHLAWTPQYDYLKLRGLCRQLDPRWKLRDESTAPSSRAADYEIWTGQQSMQTWGREHVAAALETALKGKKPSWKRFHAVIGERAGATYEIRAGVGFIVDRTGIRPRRVRAAAISRALSLDNLERVFGEPWTQAPYGVSPKKERGYGYGIERWQIPTLSIGQPSVERLYRRFVDEQKRWKSIGKWKAKEERRIVNDRMKRDAETAEKDSQEAMMILRSMGGVQGETARTVLSMLVRYDQDRAEKEAKAQIATITAKRPAELFRQWLKDRAAEGDVAAGVALIRLKNQPLDGEAILSLFGDPTQTIDGDKMSMQQAEVEELAQKILQHTRDLEEAKSALPSLGAEQQVAVDKALVVLEERGATADLQALMAELKKAGATKEQETFAMPALIAVAGAGILDKASLKDIYPIAFEQYAAKTAERNDAWPLSYVELGPKYAEAWKPKNIPGQPIPDENLSEKESAIKRDIKAILDPKNKQATWSAVYTALERHGLTYGAFEGKNATGLYRGGGLYVVDNSGNGYKYSQKPYELDLGIKKMEGRLGGIVEKNNPASTLTLAERRAKNVDGAFISEEEERKFADANKQFQEEQKKMKNNENREIKDTVIEQTQEKTSEVLDGTAQDEDLKIPNTQEETINESNEQEEIDSMGRIPSREQKKQPSQYTFEDEELAELHGNLHGKYSLYIQQFGSGLYDVQRSLYKERESIVISRLAAEFEQVEKTRGPEYSNAVTIAFADRLKSLGVLEDAWIRETDVLREAIGDNPQTYAEWLREREEEKAKALADVVEKQENQDPHIYRPINGNPYLVLAKNLEWESNKAGVQFMYAGKHAFSDDGEMLKIVSSKDKEAMQVALLLANTKYGFPEDDRPKGVYLTGSLAYKRRIVEIAAEMGIPIANEELQPLYEKERQKHIDEKRVQEKEQLTKTPEVGLLRKEIIDIQKDASLDPEKTETPEEKQEKITGRNNRIDDAIAKAAARHYDDERKEPVRILEPEEVAQGELENILMFNRRCYAVVRTANEQSGKVKPEIILARVTREQGKDMLNQIGREIIVERPLTGFEHEIEYTQSRNGGGARTR